MSFAPRLPALFDLRAAELAATTGAVHWACNCEWVPGTGHCRNRDCSAECLFRPQRETEARQIIAHRRQRRTLQQHFRGHHRSR